MTRSTRSVAVTPEGSLPESRTPITSGMTMVIGCPSIAASASMPPTPQPRIPSPLIMVVWLSVPTSVSGNAVPVPFPFRLQTTRPRYSRFTWWQIPVPGGTTRKSSNACWPHLRNV